MATVVIQRRKRKTGIKYAVRYKDPWTRRSSYYGTYNKLKEAQAKANDLRAQLDSGKPIGPQRKRFVVLRFYEVAEKLKAEWQTKQKRGDLTEKVYYDYCLWLNQLNKVYGARLLSDITRAEIEGHILELAGQSSHVNANKHLSAVKKVFKLALKINAIAEDVTAEIKSLKEHERNTFLYPNQIHQLIKATEQTKAKYYMPAMIYLGAEHGASKQEILSLHWSDINFDFGEDGLIRFYRTKNKKERTEFLMPRTRRALLDWKAHLELKRRVDKVREIKSDRVFCRIDGTPINNFNRAWWAVLKLAGISDFHFHDLRHTFCSNLLLSGADLKDAKEMIGHSDISMTDRYAHLSIGHKLSKQRQLAVHYSNESFSN